jgi:hypothetical protein
MCHLGSPRFNNELEVIGKYDIMIYVDDANISSVNINMGLGWCSG